MYNYDLRTSPKCPYGKLKWNKYYWEYPREIPLYENDYWGKEVIDPDGKIRDMQSEEERRNQIEDLSFILNVISTLPAGKILDVGCGPGHLLSAINDTWDKYGIDISNVALKEAEKYAKVKKGELPSSGYESNYFDVVVMNHVIEHLKDPLIYINSCWQILKPNGILIIATPDFDSGCARLFFHKYRMLHDNGHISLFTTFSLVKMLEDFNFRIIDTEFPFFQTRWMTKENLMRLFDNSQISPPFYGNHVIVLAEKPKFI